MASRAEELVRAFSAGRVIVVGDVMIDEYLSGETDRVSPEAPVPVVHLRRRSYAVGGAANAAANVAALGGKVSLAGVVGEDQHAETLRGLLTERMVDHRLLGVGDRPTTTKTRVLANGQQVGRVDTESASAIPAEAEQELIEWATEKLDGAGAVLLCDYEKGSLTDGVAQGVIAAAVQRATPVVADPKWHFSKFRGSTVLTPNVAETLAALGRRDGSAIDTTEMSSLFDTVAASCILVTRGSDGMSLFRAGGDVVHIRTTARHVYDVTGAGDTVAATLALGIATDLDLAEAARAANAAAGVVIGKVGTATVDPGEFVAALGATHPAATT
jgi:D-beta-D-heptose 7-phosphate kinase/D-beta-D-heptose 1-phosphate adenosyltransferase